MTIKYQNVVSYNASWAQHTEDIESNTSRQGQDVEPVLY